MRTPGGHFISPFTIHAEIGKIHKFMHQRVAAARGQASQSVSGKKIWQLFHCLLSVDLFFGVKDHSPPEPHPEVEH